MVVWVRVMEVEDQEDKDRDAEATPSIPGSAGVSQAAQEGARSVLP